VSRKNREGMPDRCEYRLSVREKRWNGSLPSGRVVVRTSKSAPPESRKRGYVATMPNENDISHEATADPLVADARKFLQGGKVDARRRRLIALFTQAIVLAGPVQCLSVRLSTADPRDYSPADPRARSVLAATVISF
jgi:hypothetical protein